MIGTVLTWLMSNSDVRKIIRAVRKTRVYITTKYYMYTVFDIKIVGSLYYRIELIDRIPLRTIGIDLKVYEKDHRPETNMYIKRDDFIKLVTDHAEWNDVNGRALLRYDNLS